jgi:hypothetical protein
MRSPASSAALFCRPLVPRSSSPRGYVPARHLKTTVCGRRNTADSRAGGPTAAMTCSRVSRLYVCEALPATIEDHPLADEPIAPVGGGNGKKRWYDQEAP